MVTLANFTVRSTITMIDEVPALIAEAFPTFPSLLPLMKLLCKTPSAFTDQMAILDSYCSEVIAADYKKCGLSKLMV